jgi:hypothetical protein
MEPQFHPDPAAAAAAAVTYINKHASLRLVKMPFYLESKRLKFVSMFCYLFPLI